MAPGRRCGLRRPRQSGNSGSGRRRPRSRCATRRIGSKAMATAEEVRVEADVLAVAAEAGEFAGLLGKVDRKRRLSGWPVDCAWWAAAGARAVAAGGRWPRSRARRPGGGRGAVARFRAVCPQHVGFAALWTKALRPGELVHAGEVIDGRGRHWTALDPDAQTRQVRLLSVGRVAVTAGEKRSLAAATGAEAVEMEAAGVAAEAARHGWPFYCLRVVSDGLEEGIADGILTFTATRMGRFSRPSHRRRLRVEAVGRAAAAPFRAALPEGGRDSGGLSCPCSLCLRT